MAQVPQTVAVVGPHCSGKTLLIRALTSGDKYVITPYVITPAPVTTVFGSLAFTEYPPGFTAGATGADLTIGVYNGLIPSQLGQVLTLRDTLYQRGYQPFMICATHRDCLTGDFTTPGVFSVASVGPQLGLTDVRTTIAALLR